MLPPMKLYSIDATIVSMPSMRAGGDDDGVLQPGGLDAGLQARFVRLGVGEGERIGGRQVLSYSVQSPSNSVRSRSAAPMRKWCPHFGQTLRFVARSLL